MKKRIAMLMALALAGVSLQAAEVTLNNAGQQNNNGTKLEQYPYYSLGSGTTYFWSDKGDPNPANDYIVDGKKTLYVPVKTTLSSLLARKYPGKVVFGIDYNPFMGKSLTIKNGSSLKVAANSAGNADTYAARIDTLNLEGGAKITTDATGAEALKGEALNVLGDKTTPSLIEFGANAVASGKSYCLKLQHGLVGSASSVLKVSYSKVTTPQPRLQIDCKDTRSFFGTINIGQGVNVTFMNGILNGAVATTDQTATLSISNIQNTAAVVIRTLTLAAGTTFEGRGFNNCPKSGIYVGSEYVQKGVAAIDFAGVEINESVEKVIILQVPESAGKLIASNFSLDGAKEGYELKCETKDGVQVLAVYNDNYIPGPDIPENRITLTESDVVASNSYFNAGLWEDGKAPHEGADYEVNPNFELYCDQVPFGDASFAGASLYLAKMSKLRLAFATDETNYRSYPVTVNQLYMDAGCTICPDDNSDSTYLMRGKATVFATSKSPAIVRTSLGGCRYEMAMTLEGGSAAYLRCRAYNGTSGDFDTFVDFTGDTKTYQGTIEVALNTTARFGNSGLPNGTILLTDANGVMASVADEGRQVLFKAVEATKGKLRIPVKCGWRIDELTLSADAAIDCTEFIDRPIEAGGLMVMKKLTGDAIKLDFGGQLIVGGVPKMKVLSIARSAVGEKFSLANFNIVNFVNSECEFTLELVDDFYTLYILNPEAALMPGIPGTIGESTGYVTLTETETATTVAGGNYSYNRIGKWSDGNAPHSTTNYAVIGAKEMWIPQAKSSDFKGNQLVIGDGASLRFSGNSTSGFAALCMQPGSFWQSAGSSAGTQTVGGSIYIYGTEQNPVVLKGGVDGQRYAVTADIVSGVTRKLVTRSTGSVVNERWTEVDFSGDCSGFRGTLEIGTNTVVTIGDSGLPKGRVVMDNDYARFCTAASNGVTVTVASFSFTTKDPSGLSAINVAAGNTLAIESLALMGKLSTAGTGIFVVSGKTTFDENAELEITEGGLGIWSSTAMQGIPLVFGDGATLHIPYKTEDRDLARDGFRKNSMVTLNGKLNITIDLGDAEIPQNRVAEVNFLTVPNESAAFYREHIGALHAPWPGGKTGLIEKTGDDYTTFAMKIQPNGFGVVFE